MSMSWKIPDVQEHEHGKPPSVWWSVIAFVVIQIAGIIITVLTWQNGKPVISGTFFVRTLLLPLLAWGVVCALIYTGYEDWIERVDWWNYLCRSAHARWRRWAQVHLAIVNSIALTPEVDLAERLLGLEGTAPANPGKVLPLPASEVAAGQSRFQLVLEQLVTPFSGHLSRFAGAHTFHIVLQSEGKQDETELRALLRTLELRNLDLVKISRIEPGTESAMFERWLSDNGMPDFCLLLGCQLHDEGKERSWSEAAVAMLFASPGVIARYRDKLKL